MANEKWGGRYERVKGRVELIRDGTELILRHGVLILYPDSGCVKIHNTSNQWWSFDKARFGLGTANVYVFEEHLKVSPGNERKICAPFGAVADDIALYNLTFHAIDPVPATGGGVSPLIHTIEDIFEPLGFYGKVALGLGVLGISIYGAYKIGPKIYRGVKKVVPIIPKDAPLIRPHMIKIKVDS